MAGTGKGWWGPQSCPARTEAESAARTLRRRHPRQGRRCEDSGAPPFPSLYRADVKCNHWASKRGLTMANERHSNSRLRLRVNASAESILRSGHPWLFAESVRDQNREGQLGDLAVIYDHNDRFLAVGLFDPDSPIRVRVLHAGKPEPKH